MSEISVDHSKGNRLVHFMDNESGYGHTASAAVAHKDTELQILKEKIGVYEDILVALSEFYREADTPSEDILDLAWEMYSSYHGSMGNAMIFRPEVFKEAYHNGNRNTESWVVAAKAVWSKANDGR